MILLSKCWFRQSDFVHVGYGQLTSVHYVTHMQLPYCPVGCCQLTLPCPAAQRTQLFSQKQFIRIVTSFYLPAILLSLSTLYTCCVCQMFIKETWWLWWWAMFEWRQLTRAVMTYTHLYPTHRSSSIFQSQLCQLNQTFSTSFYPQTLC